MQKLITARNYFNPDGCDILDEPLWLPEDASNRAKPTGMVNWNKNRYKWAGNIYKNQMLPLTWFISEVDTSTEKKAFADLSDNHKGIYETILAGLSFLDSAQEQHILDIRAMANNRLVKAVLTRQSWEEVNHQESYAQLLDVVGNSEEVFNRYQTDDILMTKNEAVAQMFSKHINGRTAKDMLMSSVASLNLESIMFISSFGLTYACLGDKVPGTRDTIVFIQKDEMLSHLPTFNNIYRTLAKKNKLNDAKTINETQRFIEHATEIELKYGLAIFEKYPVLGINKNEIELTVKGLANERLKALGLETIYPEQNMTNMRKLIDKHLNVNSIKSNLFEGNNKNYSKGSIDFDDI